MNRSPRAPLPNHRSLPLIRDPNRGNLISNTCPLEELYHNLMGYSPHFNSVMLNPTGTRIVLRELPIPLSNNLTLGRDEQDR
jgi:hypothetical protein